MMSAHQIERYFRNQHWEKLLRGVGPFICELPLPLHVRLSQQPAAAIALGLRRITELTYGPSDLAAEMTQALIMRQLLDGSMDHDLLATVATVDILSRLIADCHMSQGESQSAQLVETRQRALIFIMSKQDENGLFRCDSDHSDHDHLLTSTFLLALLINNQPFRNQIRFLDLLSALEQREIDFPKSVHVLWQLALTSTTSHASNTESHNSLAA